MSSDSNRERLISYGCAVLVIVIAAALLWFLGVFNEPIRPNAQDGSTKMGHFECTESKEYVVAVRVVPPNGLAIGENQFICNDVDCRTTEDEKAQGLTCYAICEKDCLNKKWVQEA